MKQIFSLLLIFIFSISTYSQRISIQWNGSQVHDFGIGKLNLPHFQNEGLSFDQNNIFIHIKQKIGEKEIKINNLQWENVPLSELYDLDQTQLPDHNIAEVSYHKIDENNNAFISIATFKYENGQIKRLTSFSIDSGNVLVGSTSLKKVGTATNPLVSGNFYKIKVDKSGIFKITSQFLQSNGINPSSINPRNFRIYGNGGIMLPENNTDTQYDALQENAIQVIGEEDGVWNDGDYALFYAQGPNGYNLYNTTNGNGFKRNETRTDNSNHLKNIYEDFSYYYINFDIGSGKRVQNEDVNISTPMITRYDEYQFINNDKINLMKVGRIWVEDTYFTSNKTVSFTTNTPIQNGDLVRYRTQVIGYKSQGNTISYSINNLNPVTVSVPQNFPGFIRDFVQTRYNGNITGITGNTITLNYSPNITANPNGVFYMDYAEVQYKQDLIFNGSQMNFRDFSLVSGSGQKYAFSVGNGSGIEQIWDVSDITNANRRVNKATGNSVFNFAYITNNAFFNNEFVAFRADASYTPVFIGKIENQNLHALQDIDYLVIAPPEMVAQGQRIANYHQNANNFNTAVVDVNKIYEEFGNGGKDITAIRNFVSFLNKTPGTLKYVLIIGDTTYDFKNRIANNDNVMSSYQSEYSADYIASFVTDDYFVMTAPQTSNFIGIILPNLPVGRIPASNLQQAKEMVDKTLAYYNSLPGQSTPFGNWRMKMDFIVDDDNDGGIPFHNFVNTGIVETFEGATDKPEYNIKKLYLDSFVQQSSAGGPRYPQINQTISNNIGNRLFMFYFGHGGPNGWAQERVLTSDEIINFNNFSSISSRFPLVSTITCEFTLWDEPSIYSAGERTIKLKNGGAAAMITSSRAIDVSYGIGIVTDFTKKLFQLYSDDFETIGNAFLTTRINFGTNQNHAKVNLLGDPAMKLSRPKRLLKIDQINTPVAGLIRALDFVTITGHVENQNGSINTTFNGKVTIEIFDKRLNKTTLNNDGALTPVLNYSEEGSAIVKASGTVINGLFTVEFYVPNDINYTIGTGRILAYADNNVFDVFINMPYQIGGINPNGISDNEPPKVHLYMNNTNFANGGITNQNPMLLACVTDDKGINSTGSGIGHDIITYLDGQVVNSIILNDAYNPGEGLGCANPSLADYQKGYVTYPFRNLALGEHQLTFKIWDINNNSTTETLDFVVKDETDQHLQINRLLNWPNPFTDKTYIQFEHNCDDILEVNVQIFTITGKLVRTFSQTINTEPFLQGYRTPKQALEWDGKDDFGDTVAKGTYIFKVFARSQNQEKCKGSATAIEKMVLLK